MWYCLLIFVFLAIFGNASSTNPPMKCKEISVTFGFQDYGQWNVTASATISVYRKMDIQYISISNFTVDSGFTNDSATSYCVSEICTSDFDKPFEIAVKNTTLEITAFFPTYSFGLYDVSVDDASFYGEEGFLFDMMDNKCLSDFYNQTNLETTTTQCCTNFTPAPQASINAAKCKKFQSRTSILDVDNNFSVDGTSTMTFTLNGSDITGSGSIFGSNGHEYIATFYVDDSTCNGHPESNNITCRPFTLPDGDSLALIRVNFMELNGSRYDSSFDGMVGRILIRNDQTLMEEGEPFTATNNCFFINYRSDSHPFSQFWVKMNWIFIFEMIFYIFHFSMFLMLVIKRNGFTGAFFEIFRIVLAADLLCYICTFAAMKFPTIFGFSKMDPLMNTIILAASLYFAIMEFLGHLLFAFNRFTLLWYPRTMIWQNRWFLWLLLIFPLIQAIFQFTPYVLTFSSLVLICSTCLAAIFNTLTFLKLYLVQHADNIKRVKEMNLMIVSFVIFIAQVLRSSFDVCLFLGDNDAQRFMFTIFPILQCIFAISGSISMLTLSKKARTSYILFYFPTAVTKLLFKSPKPVIITLSRAPTKSSVNRF